MQVAEVVQEPEDVALLPLSPTNQSGLLSQPTNQSGLTINLKLTIYSLFVVAIILGSSAELAGSTWLLGVFCAGLSFSNVPGLSTALSTEWRWPIDFLASLFFMSIGFIIPIREMFSAQAVWQGLILTVLAFTTKYVTGCIECCSCSKISEPEVRTPAHTTQRRVSWANFHCIGSAMVSRGEFGFLMITAASKNNLVDQETLSVVLWALTLSTLISPPMFSYFLRKRDSHPKSVCNT